MAPCLLVWALPGEWHEWDVDEPLVEEQLAVEIKRRWSDYNLDDHAERILIEPAVNALRQARAAGTLLWAIRAQGDGTDENPLSTVSLSIALVDLVSDRLRDGQTANATVPSAAVAGLRERAKLIALERSMTGFVVEQRSPVDDFGPDFSLYKATVFVVPPSLPVTAAVCVSTFDPTREEEAREAAGFVARTIHFIPAEEP
jgi:hypothetical protein